jgi:ABC-type transport system involved in cytochrome bd biosynthesis fused ATPase/permease subunit
MSLLKVVFKYMRQSLMHSSVLLFSLGIVSCVEFTTTTLLSNPECENFFVYFGLLYLFDLFWNRNVVFNAKLTVKNHIRNKFIIDGWRKYEKLSLIDKNLINIHDYKDKLVTVANSIALVIDWGLHECMVLIKTLAILFYVSQNHSVVVLILCSLSIYNFVFRVAEINFRKQHKEYQKQIIGMRREANQRIMLLQFAHTQTEDIEDILQRKIFVSKKSDRGWNYMARSIDYINFTNFLILVYLQSEVSKLQTVLLMSVFVKFSTAVKWIVRFSHSLQRGEDSYKEYIEMFKNAKFSPLPIQKTFPKIMKINDIDIDLGDVKLKLVSSFSLHRGDRILITGPSGGGKTTTLHAIRGLIPGVTLAKDKSGNFVKEFVELCESLYNMDFAKSTVKKLCVQRKDDVFSSKLARKCLKICCVDYWSDKLKDDDEFGGKISTGEKSRVIIALLVLYPVIYFNKKVLILDEPERGLDPPVAYKVLSNILSNRDLRNKIIIIVSHLEKIPPKSFNKHIRIDDGKIFVKKLHKDISSSE